MAHVVQHSRDDSWGTTHGTYDTDTTLCGEVLNHDWTLIGTTMTHNITCKECLQIIKEKKEKK